MSDIYNIALLSTGEVREAVERNIERDASAIALDKRVPHASVVATQVKYLQRARRKLPRMYEARCIIPPRAFEQSSIMADNACAHEKFLRSVFLLVYHMKVKGERGWKLFDCAKSCLTFFP